MENGDGVSKAQQNRRMTADWFRSPPTDYLNAASLSWPRGLRTTLAEVDENNGFVEVLYYRSHTERFHSNGIAKDDAIIKLFVDSEDMQDATSQSNKFAAIHVQSKSVLDALKPALSSVHCPLPDHVSDQHRFYPPYNDLFFAQGRILETLKHAGLGNVKEKQLRVFVSIMYMALKKTNHAVRDMVGKRNIDFEHVWTLFPPGSFAITEVAEVFHIRQVVESPTEPELVNLDTRKGAKYMPFIFHSYDFDGYNFGPAEDKWYCAEWKGLAGVSSLPYRPLAFHERYEDNAVAKKAAEKGRKSIFYQTFHYCHYKGKSSPTNTDRFSGIIELDERVIVDCLQSRKCHAVPDEYYYGLVERKITPTRQSPKEFYQSLKQLYVPGFRRPTEEQQSERTQFFGAHDELLMLMKPLLPAFSIRLNEWFWVDVANLEPVKYEVNPMDRLIDSTTKQMGLVNMLIKRKLDMMANEQKGDSSNRSSRTHGALLIMFSGDAGTGKNATVEAIAELHQRPLLQVKPPETGGRPHEARSAFLDILRNATVWQALLVFSNAVDMFGNRWPATETAHEYTALLEQFHGVAFLTKREKQRFTPQLTKRIQAHVEFRSFTPEKRQKIWKLYLSEARLNVAEDTIRQISAWKLNGHEMNLLLQNMMLIYPAPKTSELSLADIEAVKSITPLKGGKLIQKQIDWTEESD